MEALPASLSPCDTVWKLAGAVEWAGGPRGVTSVLAGLTAAGVPWTLRHCLSHLCSCRAVFAQTGSEPGLAMGPGVTHGDRSVTWDKRAPS